MEVEVKPSAIKERTANTAEHTTHTVDTLYAKVEVGWVHFIPTTDAIKGHFVGRGSWQMYGNWRH